MQITAHKWKSYTKFFSACYFLFTRKTFLADIIRLLTICKCYNVCKIKICFSNIDTLINNSKWVDLFLKFKRTRLTQVVFLFIHQSIRSGFILYLDYYYQRLLTNVITTELCHVYPPVTFALYMQLHFALGFNHNCVSFEMNLHNFI